MGDLRTSEIVSLVYFSSLVAMSWGRPVSAGKRLRVCGVAIAVWCATALVAAAPWPVVLTFRDWLPAVLLLLAYWAPSDLVTFRHERFERWLLQVDVALFSNRPGARLLQPRRAIRELLEVSYLLVYPLIPLAFAWLLFRGLWSEADRFWTTVLISEYLCYGSLPLLPTRPPRQAAPAPGVESRSVIRAINVWVLGRASNQWNTFPSGHVAGAVACALVMSSLLPITGVVLLVLAIGIALGSVVGRYHYAADAIAAVIVALVTYVVVAFT